MRQKWVLFGVLIVAAILLTRGSSGEFFSAWSRQLAATFFKESTTPEAILAKYQSAKPQDRVKILLVPGHDSEHPGAAFGDLYEAEMNLAVARELAEFLARDKKLEVTLARGESGYNPLLENYYQSNLASISAFVARQKQTMSELVSAGQLTVPEGVSHASAKPEIAYRLYAVNQWAATAGIDLILHLHFNDYPRRNRRAAGRYSGFTVYVPDAQYSTARASRAAGEAIAGELGRFFPASDHPQEQAQAVRGVVADQELIATGAANTLDSAAVLIEYGYVYESPLTYPAIREGLFKELAWQTFTGVEKFLNKDQQPLLLAQQPASVLLPHRFAPPLGEGLEGEPAVLALQAALVLTGDYPPAGLSLNDCPLTGNFKKCTAEAVRQFQIKSGLEPTGAVGPATAQKINTLYAESL